MHRFSMARMLVVLSICGFFSLAHADTLLLTNGDKLSGEIIKKEGDTVTLKTAYAGDVKVKWRNVAHIQTDQPVQLMLADDSRLNGTLLAAEAGKVKIKSGTLIETTAIDLKQLAYINPSPEVSGHGVKISGIANVGYTTVSGNSNTKNLHADGEWIARTRDNRFTVAGVVNRASDSGRRTTSNSRGDLKYDHFLSKKWYLYTNASAENDRFKDLNLRTTLGGGSGYQLYETPALNLSVEGGLNYVNEDYELKADKSYPSARWALKYDQLLFNTLTAFHEHEGLIGIGSTKSLLVRTKTGLRFPLAKQVLGTVQWNVDWDRYPAAGNTSTDKTLMFNVGYRW